MALVIKRHGPLVGPYTFAYNPPERLWFAPQTWTYFRETPEGMVSLSGVTGTIHIINKSDVLVPWATKKCVERIKHEMDAGYLRGDGFYEILAEELEKILYAGKVEHKTILDDAAECGHIAHDHVEQIIKAILAGKQARILELLAKLPDDERAANCVGAAVEWMVAHDVRWVGTERKIFSREHLYAGTLDGLAYVSSCDDPMCCPNKFVNRLSLVDWKTSNYLYTDYLLQTASYWKAHVEETGDPIEDRWVIRLGKEDGEFDPWHAEGEELFKQDFTAFEQCLALTRSMAAIEARIDSVKEQRKGAMTLKLQAAKLEAMKVKCPKAKDYKGQKKSKCLADGSQCETCAKIYAERHTKAVDPEPEAVVV